MLFNKLVVHTDLLKNVYLWIPFIYIILKILFVCLFAIGIRGTVPRYRFDQATLLNWKHFIFIWFYFILYITANLILNSYEERFSAEEELNFVEQRTSLKNYLETEINSFKKNSDLIVKEVNSFKKLSSELDKIYSTYEVPPFSQIGDIDQYSQIADSLVKAIEHKADNWKSTVEKHGLNVADYHSPFRKNPYLAEDLNFTAQRIVDTATQIMERFTKFKDLVTLQADSFPHNQVKCNSTILSPHEFLADFENEHNNVGRPRFAIRNGADDFTPNGGDNFGEILQKSWIDFNHDVKHNASSVNLKSPIEFNKDVSILIEKVNSFDKVNEQFQNYIDEELELTLLDYIVFTFWLLQDIFTEEFKAYFETDFSLSEIILFTYWWVTDVLKEELYKKLTEWGF